MEYNLFFSSDSNKNPQRSNSTVGHSVLNPRFYKQNETPNSWNAYITLPNYIF